ncbi:hypothetical protein CLOM_g6829 [Closterium sp. NIES-68]|nr:hypothetical protein CLOM_g6829 [Closterium sp. NIES-68]GJP72361.1 hypothetical protein CLOP_g3103 [Closterium sp. NIES-67]GJP75037.1 hypothetical protein CLOP_g5533 [Closterium sp. NIES-67]
MNFAGLSSNGYSRLNQYMSVESSATGGNGLNACRVAVRPRIDIAADAQSLAACIPLIHALSQIKQQQQQQQRSASRENNAYSPRFSSVSHQAYGNSSHSNAAAPAGEMPSSFPSTPQKRANSDTEIASGANVLLALRIAAAASCAAEESTDNNAASSAAADDAQPSSFRLSLQSRNHAAPASPTRASMAGLDLNASPAEEHDEVEQKSGGSGSAATCAGSAEAEKPHKRKRGGGQQPIKTCPKCGKQFATGQALGGHMRKHWDGPLNVQTKQLLAQKGRSVSEVSELVIAARAAKQRKVNGETSGCKNVRSELDLSLSL